MQSYPLLRKPRMNSNKKLYIFGDSFSTNFSTCQTIEKEKTWPYLLSNKLNLKIEDHAHSGISNQGMLQMIYRNLNIDDCGMIIFGLTFFHRIYDFYKNSGIDLKISDTELLKNGINDYEINFYRKKMLDDVQYDESIKQQLEQFHFIFRTLKSTNKPFFFWSLDRSNIYFYEKLTKDFKKELIKSPVGTDDWFKPFLDVNVEWGQMNSDKHFGEYGHNQFFQYLYQYIQPKLI
jgi:hypothetical protein